MKIQLKSIKHSKTFSEETEMFNADLWINGKKIGYCKNDGRGGCTDYRPYKKEDWAIIREAEAYCNSLPPKKYVDWECPMNLESKIYDLLYEWLDKKDFAKALIYKNSKGVKMEIRWKGITLSKLLKEANGINSVKKTVNRLKREGCTILNTNLGSLA